MSNMKRKSLLNGKRCCVMRMNVYNFYTIATVFAFHDTKHDTKHDP